MKKIFIFFFLFAIINYMNAYVFKIGNFGVRWYSLLILIGVIVGILLIAGALLLSYLLFSCK